jgi:hypothetical protein
MRSPHRALHDADQLIQALLKIATNRSGGATWHHTGYAHLLLDGVVAQSTHTAGRQVYDFVDHYGQNVTAEALREHGPPIAEALGRMQMPPDLANALRLLAEAAAVDSREAILSRRTTIDRKTVLVLENIAFDHIASYARISGDDLQSSIQRGWPHARWASQVMKAINMCLEGDEVASRELFLRITRHRPGGSHTSLLEAGYLSNELLALCRDPLKRRFAKTWLVSIRDAKLCLDLHRKLEDDRDLLRDRLTRTRNGLVHGNPVHPLIIETVRDLSQYQVNTALSIALESFSTSSSFPDALRDRSNDHQRALESLQRGVSLSQMWAQVNPS